MYEIMAFLFENYKETHTTPVAFFLYYLLRQKSVQEAKKKKINRNICQLGNF